MSKAICLLAGLVVATFTTPLAAATSCGPGNHWIDGCGGGTDGLSTGALVGIDLTLDGIVDQDLTLTGPTTVERGSPLDDSVTFPGTRPVDGHLDVIETEMLSMNLVGSGVTLKAGEGQGFGGSLGPSNGLIFEQSSDNTMCESFFDIFFEVDLGGGNRAYNHQALRLQTAIDRVPPADSYTRTSATPLPLFDRPVGQPNPVQVANLITASHVVQVDDYPATSPWSVLAVVSVLLAVSFLVLRRRQRTA